MRSDSGLAFAGVAVARGAIAAGAVLLAGCTAQFTPGSTAPAVVQTRIPGVGPVTSTAPGVGGGLAVPPGMGVAPPGTGGAATGGGVIPGSYSGTGQLQLNAAGNCSPTLNINDLRLRDDNWVRYRQMSGRVDASGRLYIQLGNSWLQGRFQGPQFTGSAGYPQCSYQVVLFRNG
ncbi:MAG TPA: hypothetical protein VME92_03480 [Acetobacteraceae bacterium]|nr:hypothetical protein [Acetobacteraceae bacterium]